MLLVNRDTEEYFYVYLFLHSGFSFPSCQSLRLGASVIGVSFFCHFLVDMVMKEDGRVRELKQPPLVHLYVS